MGYRGKVVERERARELRAQAWTLLDIAHRTWRCGVFDVDECRLRLRVYLHVGLDIEAAIAFWCQRRRSPLLKCASPTGP